MRFACASVLLLAATPLCAQNAVASLVPSHALAITLVSLVDPSELLASANARIFRKNLDAAAEANPELKALKSSSPQEYEAVASAGESVAVAETKSGYIDLQANYASLYEKSLSPEDLKALVSYYGSPLGLKVVANGYAAMDGASEAARSAARLAMVSQLSPDERQAMIAFAGTPAAQHFSALYGQRQQISQAWTAGLRTHLGKDEGAAMQVAAKAYEQQHQNASQAKTQ